MDIQQNESNGSNISYLLDISMSHSLSDDDDEGNTIACADHPSIPRAVGQVARLAVARADHPGITRDAVGQVAGPMVARAERPAVGQVAVLRSLARIIHSLAP